jgi:hypothetical protein
MRTGTTKAETTLKEYVYFTHVYKMARKSLPVRVHWLASVLMLAEIGFNSCSPPKSLPINPSECASVFKRSEKTCSSNFSSIQYRVSRLIMLTKKTRFFVLKIRYKSGFQRLMCSNVIILIQFY